MDILSPGESIYVRGGFSQGVRNDGRDFLQFRPISIEFDGLRQCYSSSKVRIGSKSQGTEVTTGIKGVQLDKHVGTNDTQFQSTCQPKIQCTVHYCPGVNSNELTAATRVQQLDQRYLKHAEASQEQGGQSTGQDATIGETGSGLDSHSNTREMEHFLSAFFTKQYSANLLASFQGSFAHDWQLLIDTIVTEDNGSIIDCISLSIICALSYLQLPCDDEDPDKPFTLSQFLDWTTLPLSLTCYSIKEAGESIVVDCYPEERACSVCSFVVTTRQDQHDITKNPVGASGTSSLATIKLAQYHCRNIREQLISALQQHIDAQRALINGEQSSIYSFCISLK
ncbi:hypothetical protein BLNAU_15627 [Blattamonas nauphoetae]|uniref:Ribosomal RNA-processing protein 42 n=1 Tax=Blattamonas nauphoetae TaxID=2049346 RepID=A0ABQ9XA73_9EUKA|nr:hypothetical protein BLNAU_15627 [Blattamonas nauphoetae]